MLLEYNADVDFKGQHGITPLCEAIRTKDTGIVQILLNHEADANCADRYNVSPLITAIETANTQLIEMLLVKKADVKFKNKHGITALYVAAIKRNVDAVELLLNRRQYTPLCDEKRRYRNRSTIHFHTSTCNEYSEPNSATDIDSTVGKNWANIDLKREFRAAVENGQFAYH
ncbi:hypothetical protein Trydic_g22064 [Trypoxylus dichotomus]